MLKNMYVLGQFSSARVRVSNKTKHEGGKCTQNIVSSPMQLFREALSFPKLFKCVGIQQNGDFLRKFLLG